MSRSIGFAVRLGGRFAVIAAAGAIAVTVTFFLVGRTSVAPPFGTLDPGIKQPAATEVRFRAWVREVVTSGFTCFGRTTTGSPVAELLKERMPATIGVGVSTWLTAWAGGLALAGHLAVRHPRMATWVRDRAYPFAQAVPLAAVALGGFLICVRVGVAGDRAIGLLAAWATLTAGVLPATIALWLTALEPVLAAEYLRAAHARGLAAARIWRGIVLPTAVARGGLLPQMAFSFGAMLLGSVVVENVFGVHGTGEVFAKGVMGGESELAATAALMFVVPIALCLTAAEAVVLALDPEQGGKL